MAIRARKGLALAMWVGDAPGPYGHQGPVLQRVPTGWKAARRRFLSISSALPDGSLVPINVCRESLSALLRIRKLSEI
jgi:hypothetical protein